MGVIASGCRIAWHMGPFGGVYGTVQVAQCRTHRLYSHQGSCDIYCKRVRGQSCSSSVARSQKGGGEKQPPPQVVTFLNPFRPAGPVLPRQPPG